MASALATMLLAAGPALVLAADGLPLCTAAHDQYAPATISDGAGGLYVGWLDQRLGYNVDVYVQRVSPLLVRPVGWPDGGAGLTHVTCTKSELALAGDSTGVIAAWSDYRCSSGIGYDIYVERFTAQGARAAGWPADGRPVFSVSGDQLHPAVALDGAGGAFVAWTDFGSLPRHIVAHHVLPSGAMDPAWPASGRVLSSTVADSAVASLLPDGAGGVYVAWQDVRTGDGDIWIQHLLANGTPAAGWVAGGQLFAVSLGNQFSPRLVPDGAGGAIAVWCDRRNRYPRLYARGVDAGGTSAASWLAGGNLIATGNGEQARPFAVPDGTGGLFVTWQDLRTGISEVYAQRIAGDGHPAPGWPEGGVEAAPDNHAQTNPSLAPDGAGGVFVSWLDTRDLVKNGVDVYASRLDGAGARAAGWPATGVAVCNGAGDQRDARIVAAAPGEAIVTWTDARATATRGTDIAMAGLGAAGPGIQHAREIAALHHDGQTFLTWEPPAGDGWQYDVFRSTHAIAWPEDLAGATRLGTVGDSSAYDRHLSQVLGTRFGFALDSLAAPLDPAHGLFVHTCDANATAWYAVVARNILTGQRDEILPGVNSLAAGVTEILDRPRPVFQRAIDLGVVTPDFYTLFVPDHDTPLMPAMGNRPGLAFACAIVRPESPGESSLLMPFHFRSGSVLDGVYGTHSPGEWVLGMDDWLPNGQNTFWYGYSDGYDVTAGTIAPTSGGTVMDYTLRRIAFTLDWTLRSFPIDPMRVYAYGYSMGGAGSIMVATHLGDRFAAVMSVVGKADFSFAGDPDSASQFNATGPLRSVADALWGPLASNLPASEGGLAYEELNAGWVATQHPERPMAPMSTFAGKLDRVTGWAENIGFWNAMQQGRRGGWFYWDMHHHGESYPTLWSPIQDPAMLRRYRLDESFPAASHCDCDGDPGNGVATSGDSSGTINGFLQWNTSGVDSAEHWSRVLELRSLTTMRGLRVPRDSCVMDITLRRVQRFLVSPSEEVRFEVHAIGQGGRLAQAGEAIADARGVVTLTGVKVFRTGSRLDVWREDNQPGLRTTLAPRAGIELSRHPARGVVELRVNWPGAGPARLALYDIGGRQVRMLYGGPTSSTPYALSLDTRTLAPGLYLLSAEAGGRRVSRRMVVLR